MKVAIQVEDSHGSACGVKDPKEDEPLKRGGGGTYELLLTFPNAI